MRKKYRLANIARGILLSIPVLLSACTHSDQSSVKKNTGPNVSSSAPRQQADNKKQPSDRNLVPYFNRPPVGTPVETH